MSFQYDKNFEYVSGVGDFFKALFGVPTSGYKNKQNSDYWKNYDVSSVEMTPESMGFINSGATNLEDYSKYNSNPSDLFSLFSSGVPISNVPSVSNSSNWLGLASFIYNVGKDIYNFSEQKKQQDYERALQQQIFEREDNSVQRRVEDMRKAGLSPTLAVGGAGSGSVVTSSIPQLSGEMQILNYLQQNQAIKNMSLQNMLMKTQIYTQQLQNRMLMARTKSVNLDNKQKEFDNEYLKERLYWERFNNLTKGYGSVKKRK